MPTLLERVGLPWRRKVVSAEEFRQVMGLPSPDGAAELPEEPAFGPPVDVPTQTAVAPEVPAEELRQYIAVAEAIGFKPKHLVRERFRQTLAAAGLRCYDRKAVAAYLDHQWGRARWVRDDSGFNSRHRHIPWCWRPLRDRDRVETHLIFGVSETDQLLSSVAPYNKPVPLPVLLTVQRLLAAEPAARFYVSDQLKSHEQPANRDPFLMVVVGGEAFIVERWDEPSFRG